MILGSAALGAAWVMAAPDPVAAWGADQLFRNEFHLPITVITGPVTDNEVGRDYISGKLELRSFNALRDPAGLTEVVRAALEHRPVPEGV